MPNSVDPDETAHDEIWIYGVYKNQIIIACGYERVKRYKMIGYKVVILQQHHENMPILFWPP